MANRGDWFILRLLLLLWIAASSKALHQCEPFDLIVPEACGGRGGTVPTKAFPATPDRVVILHTPQGGGTCRDLFGCCRAVVELRRFHVQELDWPDVGFNFLIGGDGRVYMGRGWSQVGQFSNSYNERSLGIAFIGNYRDRSPADRILNTAKLFLDCMLIRGHLEKNYTLHMQEDIECTSQPAPALQRRVSIWYRYGGKVKDYINC